jgi:ribosome-binding protein aMBF1 (putative translation factor)
VIKNERQYRITKLQVERFEQALAVLSRRTKPASVLERAQEDGLRSQLEDLKIELVEYEALRSGKAKVFHSESIDELPKALIRARIAAGLTQKDLAERLGLKEQQIQKYESTGYASASFDRLRTVIKMLGVQVREEITLSAPR